MMQQIVDNAASAASVGTTLAEIMLFLKLADEYIERKCSEYDSDNLREMYAIQTAYKLHCYPVEKECSPSTLSVFREGQSAQSNELPIFFQMKGKIPVLHTAGLGLSKADHPWHKFLKPNGGLLYAIGEMLKRIVIYQQQRGERFFSKEKGFDYDATNMFLEDVKWWLVELSKAEPNDKTLGSVSARIEYFSDLINKQVFKPGENSPTRVETIIYLRDVLKDWIRPLIKGASYQESAREHFSQLQTQVVSIVEASLSFMFYVFRDTPDLPKKLPIDALRGKDSLFDNAVKTISGKLLKKLAKTEACRSACTPLSRSSKNDKHNNYPNLQVLCKNIFLNVDNQLLFPLIMQETNINNWFQKSDSGILKHFRKSVLMEHFLRVLGLIQEVCLFSIICEVLYELAGFKGDSGVYGKAASKVIHAINAYQNRIKELCKEIDTFFVDAQALQRDLFSSNEEIKNKIIGLKLANKWAEYFDTISDSYRNLQKSVASSQEIITKIHQKIVILQTDQYLVRFNLLFDFFSQLVDGFVDRKSLSMIDSFSSANPSDLRSEDNLSYDIMVRSFIKKDEKIETERDELLRQIEGLEKNAEEIGIKIKKQSEQEKAELTKQAQEEQARLFSELSDLREKASLLSKSKDELSSEKNAEISTLSSKKEKLEKDCDEKTKKIGELETELQRSKEKEASFFKKYSTLAWGGFFTTTAIAVVSATAAITMGLSRK